MRQRSVPVPTLCIGPKGCGKSLFIERHLERGHDRRLYVGTLWDGPDVRELIEAHRARRDDAWRLAEASGELSLDATRILSALAEKEPPTAVLIDGLTTWALRTATNEEELVETAMQVADTVSYLVRARSDIHWWLIDATSADFHDRAWTAPRSCGVLQGRLADVLPGLRVFRWPETGVSFP